LERNVQYGAREGGLRRKTFRKAERGATVPVHPVPVIAALQRRIEDAVPAASLRAVPPAERIGLIAVLKPLITEFSRVEPRIPAEGWKQIDVRLRQASALHAELFCCAVLVRGAAGSVQVQCGRQERRMGHRRRVRAGDARLIGDGTAGKSEGIAVGISPQRTLIPRAGIDVREEGGERRAGGGSGRVAPDDAVVRIRGREVRDAHDARRTVGCVALFVHRGAVGVPTQDALIAPAEIADGGAGGTRRTG